MKYGGRGYLRPKHPHCFRLIDNTEVSMHFTTKLHSINADVTIQRKSNGWKRIVVDERSGSYSVGTVIQTKGTLHSCSVNIEERYIRYCHAGAGVERNLNHGGALNVQLLASCGVASSDSAGLVEAMGSHPPSVISHKYLQQYWLVHALQLCERINRERVSYNPPYMRFRDVLNVSHFISVKVWTTRMYIMSLNNGHIETWTMLVSPLAMSSIWCRSSSYCYYIFRL